MPSISEGMSYAALEAAASGAALILSRNCGIDDFKNGMDGIEMRDLSSEAVTAALLGAVQMEEKIKSLGAYARRLARARDWRDFEAEIAALYSSLLNK